jgi:hypothetical protein
MKKLVFLVTTIVLIGMSCIHSSKNEIFKKGDTVMMKSDSTKLIVVDTVTFKTDTTSEFCYTVKYVVSDTTSLLSGITTTVKSTEVSK